MCGGSDGSKGGKGGKNDKERKPAWENTTGADYSNHKYGTYYEGGGVGCEGLMSAVTRALEPYRESEETSGPIDWEAFKNRFCHTIFKAADKYWKDDKRHKEWTPSPVMARCLLENFTNKVMEQLHS